MGKKNHSNKGKPTLPPTVQPEIAVIGKVLDFTTTTFPGELQNAGREYEMPEEAQIARGKSEFYSGFYLIFCCRGK